MEIESAKCEWCGLGEECTQEYISRVKVEFGGKWLCGLCSEAVKYEVGKGKKQGITEGAAVRTVLVEAVNAHQCFCSRKLKLNPAVRVAEGMRQILRRRSGDLSGSSAKRFGQGRRSTITTQVGGNSSVSNSAF